MATFVFVLSRIDKVTSQIVKPKQCQRTWIWKMIHKKQQENKHRKVEAEREEEEVRIKRFQRKQLPTFVLQHTYIHTYTCMCMCVVYGIKYFVVL